MEFSSNIGKMPVFDDSNAYLLVQDPEVNGERKTRGLIPRDWTLQPFGSLKYAAPFDIAPIPRSMWDAMIAEKERTKSRLVDICDQAGLTVLDQNGTNYCWINAPTHCVEIMRVVQGQPMVRLSPASVGGPIKGYRNQGGWGTEGLEYIVEHGVCSQAVWPANAINRQYDNTESQADRKHHKVGEWWELRPRNFDHLATCLLMGFPVAVGYNWWSHEVTAMDLVKVNGGYGIIIDNSWSTSWGEKGRGVLAEGKATPDDAVAARTITPSDK